MLLTYFKVLCIVANLGLLVLVAWPIVDYWRKSRGPAGVDEQYLKVLGFMVLLALAVLAPFI